jgi:hypothetical protein
MTVSEESETERMTDLFGHKVAAYTEEPQMRVMIECIADLYRDGEITSAIAIQLMKDLDVDYQAFHSSEDPSEGSESWRAQRSVRLLFAKTSKTDEPFRCLARAYVRENVVWLRNFLFASAIFG